MQENVFLQRCVRVLTEFMERKVSALESVGLYRILIGKKEDVGQHSNNVILYTSAADDSTSNKKTSGHFFFMSH